MGDKEEFYFYEMEIIYWCIFSLYFEFKKTTLDYECAADTTNGIEVY